MVIGRPACAPAEPASAETAAAAETATTTERKTVIRSPPDERTAVGRAWPGHGREDGNQRQHEEDRQHAMSARAVGDTPRAGDADMGEGDADAHPEPVLERPE